jgi:flagellin
MTRINTNISSLTAQNSLARSNSELNTALTRLSTGLRINSGADDPAGLIASEALASDITATTKAISNSERANEMIATADSALSQVSDLLNDIRGLVTEAANTGAMSSDQIAANQLQVDSSLEAINRIAQTTSFQGKRLLDGSLDFTTTTWTGDSAKVTGLKIKQANLGTTGSLAVDVDTTTAATKAAITATTGTAGNAATAAVAFTDASGTASGITVTAPGEGTGWNNVVVQFQESASVAVDAPTASYNADGKVLTVTVSSAGNTTVANITAAIADDTDFTAVAAGTGLDYDPTRNIPAGQQATTDITLDDGTVIRMTANSLIGAAGNVPLDFSESTGRGIGTPDVSWSGTQLDIDLDDAGVTTAATLVAAINTEGHFSAQLISSGTKGGFDGTSDDATDLNTALTNGYTAVSGTTSGGTGSGDLAGDIVFELTGSKGTQVFSFDTGTTAAQVIAAINSASDATGVTASATGSNLTLNSSDYGSEAAIDIDMISDTEGSFTASLSGTHDTGADIVGKINGLTATGKGTTLSVNSGTLSMSITMNGATSIDGDETGFVIDGGGALFQLGADVTTGQQARIGIQSLNSSSLGGVDGLLYTLGSGEENALDTDPTTAGLIVDEVITEVTSLRGRLGAFQKATLESNIAALTDAQENLTSAQSNIRDTDFAAESANLTRAQILVQSGTSVLSIANQNPQNVLSLLR